MLAYAHLEAAAQLKSLHVSVMNHNRLSDWERDLCSRQLRNHNRLRMPVK